MQQERPGIHGSRRQVRRLSRRAGRQGRPLHLQDHQLPRAAQQVHGRALQVPRLPRHHRGDHREDQLDGQPGLQPQEAVQLQPGHQAAGGLLEQRVDQRADRGQAVHQEERGGEQEGDVYQGDVEVRPGSFCQNCQLDERVPDERTTGG